MNTLDGETRNCVIWRNLIVALREHNVAEYISAQHFCYFNVRRMSLFQIMHVIFMHTAHTGHHLYNSNGIFRLRSDFRFESIILYTSNTSSWYSKY